MVPAVAQYRNACCFSRVVELHVVQSDTVSISWAGPSSAVSARGCLAPRFASLMALPMRNRTFSPASASASEANPSCQTPLHTFESQIFVRHLPLSHTANCSMLRTGLAAADSERRKGDSPIALKEPSSFDPCGHQGAFLREASWTVCMRTDRRAAKCTRCEP